MAKPVKILMVCLGNICRSSLAEGILASKLPEDKFFVDSAGTGHWHIGHQPDRRSMDVARRNGLDISHQRGRQFSQQDFDDFDYIYVMDANNYDDVLNMARTDEDRAKVRLILDELFPGEKVDVPDPYYGMPSGFDMVYRMLEETCDSLSKKLIEKHP
jgi:protein-tyrosine phosphatase